MYDDDLELHGTCAAIEALVECDLSHWPPSARQLARYAADLVARTRQLARHTRDMTKVAFEAKHVAQRHGEVLGAIGDGVEELAMNDDIKAIAMRLVEGGDDRWDAADYAESAQRAGDIDAAGQWILERLAAESQWGEPTENGWYWCEDLDDDAPPQLLRSYQPIRTNSNGTMTVDWDSPRKWQRWTIAGWVDLKGRVAPCVGRPRKAGSP